MKALRSQRVAAAVALLLCACGAGESAPPDGGPSVTGGKDGAAGAQAGRGGTGGSSFPNIAGQATASGGTNAGTTGSAPGGSGGSNVAAGGQSGPAGGTSGSSGAGQSAGATASPSSGGNLPGAGAAGTGGSAGASGGTPGSSGGAGAVLESVEIAPVWSGHPVGFYLLTHGNRQFAAFYDANRALTVAERTLGSTGFRLVRLPTSVGWDSHNDIVMAIDADGFIHVAGNMHSSPLIYFRTTRALDIDTFERRAMVGMNEERCTYPQFFVSSAGELVFMYRDGSSGNGNHVFNRYDVSTKSWSRLLDSALTDGEGARNAYPVGPIQGPDGFWHLLWVWRDSPDAATNHDLSYARTRDLRTWQTAAGRPLALPIRLSTGDIVDPVRAGGGMINNNTKIGFDAQNRPIVAYHKFDSSGNTQLYNARFETDQWVVYKTSSWSYRWAFGGQGTLVFEIEVEPVELQSDGSLTQNWFHRQYGGRGAFRLNPATLAAEATIPQPVPYPPDLAKVQSSTPQMEVRWRKDAGAAPDDGVVYLLRWETLPSNRDQPRDVIPPATPLRVYAFRR